MGYEVKDPLYAVDDCAICTPYPYPPGKTPLKLQVNFFAVELCPGYGLLTPYPNGTYILDHQHGCLWQRHVGAEEIDLFHGDPSSLEYWNLFDMGFRDVGGVPCRMCFVNTLVCGFFVTSHFGHAYVSPAGWPGVPQMLINGYNFHPSTDIKFEPYTLEAGPVYQTVFAFHEPKDGTNIKILFDPAKKLQDDLFEI